MTGAPTPDPFTDRQLQVIARLVDREVTRKLSARYAASERHRDIRLAKTVEVDGQYPTTGNTFAIRFLDCAFTPLTPGLTTMTEIERTSEGDADDAADVMAREINGYYVAKGTLVFAMWQRGLSGDPSEFGEWWIQAVAQAGVTIGKISGGDIAADDTGTVTRYTDDWTITSPAETFTVKNYHGITLPNGLRVKWFQCADWDYPIVEPFEYTECP